MASPIKNAIAHIKRHPRKYAAIGFGLVLAAAAAAVMVFCPPLVIVAAIPAVIATSPVLLPLFSAAVAFVGGMFIAGAAAAVEAGIGKLRAHQRRARFGSDKVQDADLDIVESSKTMSRGLLADKPEAKKGLVASISDCFKGDGKSKGLFSSCKSAAPTTAATANDNNFGL